jgi:hypothetical protein
MPFIELPLYRSIDADMPRIHRRVVEKHQLVAGLMS